MPPSPKSRIRPVYTVPEQPARRTEPVIYQLEDTGHATLRLRPTVREVGGGADPAYIYRVDAFSRVSGAKLGSAEELAGPGSAAEFAARSRQFQSSAFRQPIDRLSAQLADLFKDAVAQVPIQT